MAWRGPNATAEHRFSTGELFSAYLVSVGDVEGGLALLATQASADAGDYRDVARIVVTHFAEFLERPADELPEKFCALIYPTPFVTSVSEAAHRHGLDPAAMFAIMRRESRFDPNARSAVEALGLFQIMPYTATALGPRSGLDHLSSEDFSEEQLILQPSVNAALAATLARDLFTMFDDALAPVIASYNAGEDRVSIWWESAPNLRDGLFVDTIPYRETRRFAKEVIANVEGYRRVYCNTLGAQ